jgi:ketosteroid isomerase-like protein
MRAEAEAIVQAINARDFDALAAMPSFDPDFEFRSALSAAEGQTHFGLDGLRDWAESMDSVWKNLQIAIVDFRKVSEDTAVVIYRATGEARASRFPLDTQTGQVWSYRNGKVWRNVSYTDPKEALEAVGLRE